MDYLESTMLERCKRCKGAKKINGLGMLQETCPKCQGSGISKKVESKPNQESEAKEPAINVDMELTNANQKAPEVKTESRSEAKRKETQTKAKRKR